MHYKYKGSFIVGKLGLENCGCCINNIKEYYNKNTVKLERIEFDHNKVPVYARCENYNY